MADQFGSNADLQNLLRRLSLRVDALERTTPGALGGGSVNTPFSIGGYSFGGASEQIDLAELAALPYAGRAPDVNRFATADEMLAFDSSELRTGDFAYVASVTIEGSTVDAEYRWDGSAWKLWTAPVLVGDTIIRTGALITLPGAGFGSGGFAYGEMTITARKVWSRNHVYWGTTAGGPGSGAYTWRLPYSATMDAGNKLGYTNIGESYVYIGATGIHHLTALRMDGADVNNATMIPEGANNVVGGGLLYGGGTNNSYDATLEYRMAASAG